MFLQDLSRKAAPGPLSYYPNKQIRTRNWFDSRHQLKKDLEDTRNNLTKDGAHLEVAQVGRPRPRSADLWVPRISLSFLCQFPTAISFQSTPLFQVGLIEGSRFIPPAYKMRSRPPWLRSFPETLIHFLYRGLREGSLNGSTSRASIQERLVLIRI
jgi:hypothetical protein